MGLNVNIAQFNGQLVADPLFRNGAAILRLSRTETFQGRNGSTNKEYQALVRVTGGLAQQVAQRYQRGQFVTAFGSLETVQSTTKDGQKRSTTVINADKLFNGEGPNFCVVGGNLVADPETRMAGQTSVTNIRLACTIRVKDADGNWSDRTDYVTAAVWGRKGENAARFLRKGSQCVIEGTTEYRTFEYKNEKRGNTDVRVTEIHFGARDGGGGDQGNRQQTNPGSGSGGGSRHGGTAGGSQGGGYGGDWGGGDDDIPF